MKLPEQLHHKDFRFIKVAGGSKMAIEKNWATDGNYAYNDPEFVEYLSSAKNYGVLCGRGNLAIIDCDTKELAEKVALELPPTFKVKTGSGNYHFYYIVKDLDKKIVFIDKNDKHHGELQWTGFQCVGPGSLHKSGTKYKPVSDKDIEEITKDDIMTALYDFIPKKEKERTFKSNTVGAGLNWKMDKLVPVINDLLQKMKEEPLRENRDGELCGCHPVHGSTGKQNFHVNLEKGTWHCKRHNVGGDAIDLIAILHNIIPCEKCTPNHFKKNPKDFIDAKNIGVKTYGYKDNRPMVQIFKASGKKGDLMVANIVSYLASQVTFITVRDTTGRNPHTYVYKDGYYRLNGEDLLILELKRLFNLSGVQWREHYKNEILGYLRTENIVERDEITPPKYLINLNNGIYSVKTGELIRHSPDYYFLYKIPWNYNKDAKCPKIMQYFSETLKKRYVDFSQELFGYCLYYDYNRAGLFYLYGTGGNGKGIWQGLLEAMLGKNNVSNKTITALSTTRFASALLYGKLLNSCGEISSRQLKESDLLKALSAGDTVQAEFKGKDGFDFKNVAKLVTACNKVPYCTDMSEGWYQRQFIIPFLKKFRDSAKEDPELLDKLIDPQEMEGLLLWAINGLKRFIKNKYKFTYPKDKKDRYLMYQQNTRYFIDKYYIKTNDWNDWLFVDDIYEKYKEWCKENDVPVDSKNALAREMTYLKITDDKIAEGREYRYIRRYIKSAEVK